MKYSLTKSSSLNQSFFFCSTYPSPLVNIFRHDSNYVFTFRETVTFDNNNNVQNNKLSSTSVDDNLMLCTQEEDLYPNCYPFVCKGKTFKWHTSKFQIIICRWILKPIPKLNRCSNGTKYLKMVWTGCGIQYLRI